MAAAKAVLAARAAGRDAAEQATYEAKRRERAAKARRTGQSPRGRPPAPPTLGPRDGDQYNFTDPDARIMKNSTDQGFGQHHNAQVAVEQARPPIVGHALSNHPNDQREAAPTVASIPAALGTPAAAALDNGSFGEPTVCAPEARGIAPYIATGREPHHRSWRAYFAAAPVPPPADATPKERRAYALQTAPGRAIYRLRTCTVEPVIGLIKAVLGFRQSSLRGLSAGAGEWGLVCLAWNLKRLHRLTLVYGRPVIGKAPTNDARDGHWMAERRQQGRHLSSHQRSGWGCRRACSPPPRSLRQTARPTKTRSASSGPAAPDMAATCPGVSRKVGASGCDGGMTPAEIAPYLPDGAHSRPFPILVPRFSGAIPSKHQLRGRPPGMWRGVP